MTKAVVTDTPINTTFGYLYVKSFKWSSAHDNETHVGNPKAGRVYRAAFNKDTKTHRLFYDLSNQVTALFLPHLVVAEKSDEDNFFSELNYTGEIIELKKSTILDCNISEEDLDELCKWIEEDNRSIKQLMGFEQPQFKPVTGEEIVRAIQQNILRDEDFIVFVQEARTLKENNRVLFDAVGEFMWFVNEKSSHPDEPIDGSWTEFSKTLGAGKNISKALDHISKYGGESVRTNLMQEDLFGAIRSLMLEQGRRQIHGIE